MEPCPVEDYARKAASSGIVVGRLVRLACQRHLRDLEEGAARGLRFDRESARRAAEFFAHVNLAENRPFRLEPFQQFIIGSLFGWKGADGHRRFRTAYIEQGKGNGKSPLAAGVGLLGLVADGEYAAEVYAAATKKDQAMILFRDAVHIVNNTPALARRLRPSGTFPNVWNLAWEARASFFRPISSDDGQSGPRPHIGLIDEVHEHKTSLVVDMMRAGTKGRKQALIFEITNSGTNRQSVCWDHHEYSRKVLEGSLQNDAWFAYVCGLDPCETHRLEGRQFPDDGCPDCDKWHDESVWPKANPGLGTILPVKYVREQVAEAKGMPSKEGVVKRLNCCIWTDNVTAWLPAELWAVGSGKFDSEDLKGRYCWGGLDLSNRFDLTALVLVFREDESPAPDPSVTDGLRSTGIYKLLPFFWIPRDVAARREEEDGVPYRLWESQGHIRFTDGDVTDYQEIEKFLREEIAQTYRLEGLAYDPYNATQMAVNLDNHGLPVKEFRQNIQSFNEPTKEFEALLRAGRLLHGGNPVLDWMASNVEVKTDVSNNIRPVKPANNDARKIDGIVAAVMGIGLAMIAPGPSVYETRGVEAVGPPTAIAPKTGEDSGPVRWFGGHDDD